MEYVGRTLRKEFKGFGIFSGTVNSYDSSTRLFRIAYEDGDSEELEFSEVISLLEGERMVVDQSKRPARAGRKPKKRRKVQIQHDSGNHLTSLMSDSVCNASSDVNLLENEVGLLGFGEALGGELGVSREFVKGGVFVGGLNGGLDLNVDLNENDVGGVNLNASDGNLIDLNVGIYEEDDGVPKRGDSGQKKEHCFDLNLGLDDEIKYLDRDPDGLLMETKKGEIVEETPVKGSGGGPEIFSIDVVQMEDGVLRENSERDTNLGTLEANILNDCSSSDIALKGVDDGGNVVEGVGDGGNIVEGDGNSGSALERRKGRRKRKLSESGKSVTETVLRRSTRRGRVNVSAQNHMSSAREVDAVDDAISSPAVSAVSEEKPTVSCYEESEEHDVLPSKLPLPPSSGNLNLDGMPILDIFSVYAFLRSFSTLLFLSPFELEDFVAALVTKSPNLLFDFIHFSLLQTLRKHLELLSDESSQSASACLRSLNWDLLDLITWPIFMAEYLLIHSSGLKPGFDLCQLKLFESDYYKQPATVKIEVLRCLCDDVIEVEAIRSELNRRTIAAEPDLDSDRNVKLDASKKRRVAMDESSMTEEVADEATDRNSDECCLCKMDGNLICCDGCPSAFHSRCVGVANNLLPEGDWYCPECMLDKDKPWMKVGKSIRGAELLGIDPYGRLYYSSCGYLLVLDPDDTDSLFSYYQINDLYVVIEALKSSYTLYNSILHAISKLWDASATVKGVKSDLISQNATVCLDIPIKGQIPAIRVLPLVPSKHCIKDEAAGAGKPEENSMISSYPDNVTCEIPDLMNIDPLVVNSSWKRENILSCSEGSAETFQEVRGTQNSRKTGLDNSNGLTGVPADLKLPEKAVFDGDYSLTNLEVEGGKSIQSADCGRTLSKISTKRDMSEGHCLNRYVNYYGFARMSSLVAEELTRKSSDKIAEVPARSVEEIILAQVKAVSNKSIVFCWSNIRNLDADASKEKCGWCFPCQVPEDDRGCLFVMNDTSPVLEKFTSDLLGYRSKKNRRGRLMDVMCQILGIEERLRGLLLGPWLNPHYPELWRKSVLSSSDFPSVKHLLLKLASNMRPLAHSTDWVKYVDSFATVGSASHVVTSSLRVSSKHGIGRKRARCPDLEPKPSSNAATGLGLLWWRGGRLSRQLFNWKALPHSLASKAARQGGCKKIPGILYPESSEFAKRSKFVAWQASVEASRSVEQLALQVRELDANIRWDDIENTNLLMNMERDLKKSMRSFKKVIMRRKCSEGAVVKYLLDFGKRRFIPDIVARHGSVVEESSSGRKKYWLEESYVPLHLLKVFEEKRIARKSNKTSSVKLQESRRVIKKPTGKKGFAYLFSRAERSENYHCGHCNKDVLIREAVSCQYCTGFFHKRHVRKSAGAITAECKYTCHKCQGAHIKTENKKGKSQLKKGKKASKVSKAVRSKISGKAGKDKKKNNSVVVPLRRSTRKVKFVVAPNWFHGDAFGVGAANIVNLIGFKCHKCCNRIPPPCPNLHARRVDEAQFGGSRSDEGTGCAETVLTGFPLQNEVLVNSESRSGEGLQNFNLDEESKDHLLSDESGPKEQQAETAPDTSETIMVDAENPEEFFNLECRSEAIYKSDEKDQRCMDILMGPNENTASDDNAIELGEPHVVDVTNFVETKPPVSMPMKDVIANEVKSLGDYTLVKNGLVKTTATLGSVIDKTLVDSSKLPPQVIVCSGEIVDRQFVE
ncbi:hypothetical protein RJ640_009805 [Escallonia rubra]|uniref:DDT domain-containing protein PTM n=1 Tax=Escallonia rubra TaxID=112253 RepID=A0AA88R0S7_9ASTE|nr:hypothetical protein RJ640_009805 [Escallonia rubra]